MSRLRKFPFRIIENTKYELLFLRDNDKFLNDFNHPNVPLIAKQLRILNKRHDRVTGHFLAALNNSCSVTVFSDL